MSDPVKPKQASTVILLRRAVSQGIEVFLTRRPEGMPFLGGMYCYPGGTVKKDDYAPAMLERCVGLTPRQAQKIAGGRFNPERALGLWVAAAREVFEEVGVLFAIEEDGRPFSPEPRSAEGLAEQHRQLLAKSLSFCTLLENHRLRCDLSSLAFFSYWQTPAQISMRFDTRFFLAPLPPRQAPLATSYEVAHSLWVAPDRALQLFAAGELPMIFPTFAALRTLADFETMESVFKAFRPPKASAA
jgi:8-oxo-dGTP pyrophosphatase MutT (NUDIX family)